VALAADGTVRQNDRQNLVDIVGGGNKVPWPTSVSGNKKAGTRPAASGRKVPPKPTTTPK
jgi:hypothetical protein